MKQTKLERLRAFASDTRGVSTVEYALIVVAVAAIVGAGAAVLGGTFKGIFTGLSWATAFGMAAAQSADKAVVAPPPAPP